MNVPGLLAPLKYRQFSSLNVAHTSSGVIGPAVRLLLFHYNINQNDVSHSGPKGNVLKNDVLEFIEKRNLKPVPFVPKSVASAVEPEMKYKVESGQRYIDIPLTKMRAAIAKRLLISKKNIPHAYATAVVNADRLEELRARFKQEGQRVSINDFLIKAAATALRAVPEINVQYKDGEIKKQSTIDISVAVSTPSGLITPIVFNADRLGVSKISALVRDLVKKAKDNKLQPAEFEGGTFAISNLGMFGSISSFTAIINPPQAAILTVGGTRKEVGDDGTSTSLFSVSLCYDSRAITELDAQRFLKHFKMAVGEPDLMVAGTDAFYDLAALL